MLPSLLVVLPVSPCRYHCTPNWNCPVSLTSRMRVSICTCSGTLSSFSTARLISSHCDGRARTSNWLLLSTELIRTLPSLDAYCWLLLPLLPPWPLLPNADDAPPDMLPPMPVPVLLPSRLWLPLLPNPLPELPFRPPEPDEPRPVPVLPKPPAVLPMLVALALSALPSVALPRPGPTWPPLSPPLPAPLA